jgi:polyketide cyclase/dehydrase/lipid transport protein
MAAQIPPVTVVDAGPGRVSRSIEVGAPASELFAIVADPRRHHELDGSGTVVDNVSAPAELTAGSRFSTKMRMFGVPYRITSTVTAFTPDSLIEWRHPLGHHWRWEFEQVDPHRTRVTETFDYRDTGTVKDLLKYYDRMGFAKANAKGIEATLLKLRDRYAKEQ